MRALKTIIQKRKSLVVDVLSFSQSDSEFDKGARSALLDELSFLNIVLEEIEKVEKDELNGSSIKKG